VPDAAGVRRRVRLEATTEAAARLEALVLAQGEPPAPPGVTCGAWADEWVEARRVAGLSCWAHDRGRLRNWVLPVLRDVPLAAVEPRHVHAIEAGMARLGATSRGHVWGTFRGLLAGAAKAGHAPPPLAPPRSWGTEGLPLPAPRRARRALAYLWTADAARLFACRDVAVFRRRWWAVLLYTGVRTGELVALRVGDVDTRHGVVWVARAFDRHNRRYLAPKGGGARAVPIEPALAPLLAAATAGRAPDEPLLYCPPDARRADALRRAMKQAGVALRPDAPGARALRVHDLRAAYATWCLARGDSLLAVRDRLGHASATMTERYLRPGVADRDSGWFGALPAELCEGEFCPKLPTPSGWYAPKYRKRLPIRADTHQVLALARRRGVLMPNFAALTARLPSAD
jgi:integrase